MKEKGFLLVPAILAFTLVALNVFPAPAIPKVPQVQVKFASMPYFDHSYAVIGAKKGYFKDVGITLVPEPAGMAVTGNEQISVLASKDADWVSVYAPNFIAAMKEQPDLRVVVYADAFLGFAIMGRPEYKSVDEIMAATKKPFNEALKDAVQQMKGKTFCYPPSLGGLPFIELVLSKGGLTLNDLQTNVIEDAKAVELMIAGKSDFQCDGVPSHFSLVKAGFKEIVTNGHLAAFARPSADSTELLSIGHAGWGTRKDWLDKPGNHEVMLRMASVLYRIIDLMKNAPDEAFAIHVPYVNSIAGTNFTVADGQMLYKLNNFVPFEGQAPWFLDKQSPYYYYWNLAADIKLYENKGVFEPGKYNPDMICLANDTYKELVQLRSSSKTAIDAAQDAINGAGKLKKNVATAEDLLAKARHFYEWRDYVDADRFGKASVEWAKYGG